MLWCRAMRVSIWSDGAVGTEQQGPMNLKEPLRFRTVWVSDVHLGTRSCKAAKLLAFLKAVECEQLFLVGDIIDLWQIGAFWHWSRTQNEVLREVLRIARSDTEVTFVPGNHDETFRDFLGMSFGDIEIKDHVFYKLADGRRLLVLHGDQFDSVVLRHRWLAVVGGRLYDLAVILNNVTNWFRKRLGMDYWSLAAWLKQKAKSASNTIKAFEAAVSQHARDVRVDGVVCGHIHRAEIRDLDGILYCNDGDWVESCTALVEDFEGNLRILDFSRREPIVKAREPRMIAREEQAAGKDAAVLA
jgi:UDP-2,3-diacylglucosamine pyrophosphatase LpxH